LITFRIIPPSHLTHHPPTATPITWRDTGSQFPLTDTTARTMARHTRPAIVSPHFDVILSGDISCVRGADIVGRHFDVILSVDIPCVRGANIVGRHFDVILSVDVPCVRGADIVGRHFDVILSVNIPCDMGADIVGRHCRLTMCRPTMTGRVLRAYTCGNKVA